MTYTKIKKMLADNNVVILRDVATVNQNKILKDAGYIEVENNESLETVIQEAFEKGWKIFVVVPENETINPDILKKCMVLFN